ncbi:MAG TPA: hypothetical protein DHW61_11535 [Lachnoclostridium phytofermentans]|uniref:Uncharacterized protein n=1 Tax=Lachnoclostridium phytofermentans TaxID=66219 RepID=A0A3D2X7C6_9FIRM|nr:DUF4362 domain-containing protein [Lachnoclostridium sp.]HCL03021.1 hypothetical protein [Lachnoclostridium phytofermentans]
MRKIVKICTLIIVLALTFGGVYWFIIHPKTYKYDTAVKNGDVVMGAGGSANVGKFHSFIKNVENKQPDKIRITAFSKEGYPKIFDLDFDGNIIKCTTDNTRNLFGRDNTKKYGEYTKITKDEKNDYMLEDETGKGVWIFQE